MKALTVRQPWASLIVLGIKQMETRSWHTHYRGSLVIHAAEAAPGRRGRRMVGEFEVEKDRFGLLLRGPGLAWPYRLPLGAAIGVTELFQIRSTTHSEHAPDDRQLSLGDHSPGRYAWSLTSSSPIREVYIQGRLGLWDFPDELIAGDRYDRQRSAA